MHSKIPKKFVYDRYCVEPVTIQATVRELGTFIYQLHILIKRIQKNALTPVVSEELVKHALLCLIGFSSQAIRARPSWIGAPKAPGVLQRCQQLSTDLHKDKRWL